MSERHSSSKQHRSLVDDRLAIEAAMAEARRAAVEHHRRHGIPLIEWHDSKVVYVSPEDAILPADPDANDGIALNVPDPT